MEEPAGDKAEDQAEEQRFVVEAPFPPAGDQPKAIAELSDGILGGERFQTLLGITADGWYGPGTQAAHIAELEARGLSTDNVPNRPPATTTVAPETTVATEGGETTTTAAAAEETTTTAAAAEETTTTAAAEETTTTTAAAEETTTTAAEATTTTAAE